MSVAASPVETWPDLNRQWLVAAIDTLRQRLQARASGVGGAEDAVEATPAAGFTPALVHCARVFGLSPFERELLLLVAGLELDEGLREAVAAAGDGATAQASFGLALALLTRPHSDALSSDAPLRHWRMVEPEPVANLARATLRIDERILHYLTGIVATDAVLAGVASPLAAEPPVDEADPALVERIARALRSSDSWGPVVVLRDHDRDPAGRRDLALAALARLGRPALWLEARDLPTGPDSLLRLATHVDRETALTGCVPAVSVEGAGGEAAAVGLVARLRSGVLWLGTPAPQLLALPQDRRVLRFDLAAPDARGTRLALRRHWQRLAPAGTSENEDVLAALDRAGRQFHLARSALDNVLERVRTAPPADRAAEIWPAAREAARDGLDAIAQRVETRVTLDDVVLPSGQSAMLRDIARHLQQRERVYGDWGFGAKHQLGQGLVALFAGESGTGKTLAAEAIANEVDLDLYRVDLATLVSKYIGETEKNLKRLFDAAEASGAVLLFDEADALFGKRSDVKDSHDRYANIEVAYLLQRVEAYRGLAVLTTNMKSALDQAFLRRIRFIVSFPFPDAAARERIWRRQFPPEAPLGEVDFKALARLNLPGGNIRSIAVNAAFKAADAGTRIDQPLLAMAAHEEFAKLERSMGSAAMGGMA
ncbi:ATP-binding protein [Reyranella sp.]|uniref:ATP-binding protein n=1 Tax=Reyranella sp. TaxID=1929291 RepID=UPI003BAAB992